MRNILTAVALFAAVPAFAQDENPVPAQKAAAESVIKELGVEADVKETEHLLFVTDLPAEQAAKLPEYLEQQYAVTWKVLDIGEREQSWKGKLTVYALTDRSDFNAFLRAVEKRQPKDRQESVTHDFRREPPHVVVAVGLGEDAENLPAKTLRQLSVALLHVKGGGNARLPTWVEDGFVKALQMRSNPNGFRKERASMQQLARIAGLTDVWGATGEQGELLAASFMDFLAFGPQKEKLGPFLRAFTPGEGNENPDPWRAMESADFDRETVAYAWKRWALTGK